jgi:geranylgeranyl diphosphate synthase type I
MIQRLTTYKDDILPYENDLIDDACENNKSFDDVATKLKSFTNAGKHVRGGLYLAATSWWRGLNDDDYIIAACIELLHTAMLIQDDIMDDDDRRRGQQAIHAFFNDHHDDHVAGDGIAVCCSDLLIFASMTALGRTDSELVTIAGRGIQSVAIGQLRDITNDDVFGDGSEPSRDDIISVYKEKTGRYTFTLPLQLACVRAQQSRDDSITELGDYLGVVFQLRDDELNIYGDETETGKPTMSDVEENKHTILRDLVLERHPDLRSLFGTALTDDDRATLAEAFADVKEKHKALKEHYTHIVRQRIADTSLDDDAKDDLRALAKFVATRNK